MEQALQEEPRLYWECLNCFVKANTVEKTIEIIGEMNRTGNPCNLEQLTGAISYYQSEGLCSAFKTPKWEEFKHQAFFYQG
ncbi:hypothetical protein A3842_11925 [Paenibacillus sp. P3E]|uniref:hypothetical protein n=1 Tax=unclassified Paenibacillus TaxID=185978 RepID=UPI00093F497D|nr:MULTISPECIES: hypothetical protein [unclassified Paenibacillus]OKP80599.1 hypothetical protein A3842_11925 [Paenibacillus sp. P3E]OKP94773.1 hypothetical protein A3848_02015 [Paenibacillus sp. P32E]